jgi:hypothetical protein
MRSGKGTGGQGRYLSTFSACIVFLFSSKDDADKKSHDSMLNRGYWITCVLNLGLEQSPSLSLGILALKQE